MTDNLIFLTFTNGKAPVDGAKSMLACAACRNKTFTCRTDLGEFPVMECSACDAQIGAFGWSGK